MIIAIDYDGTYNSDLTMFSEIIRLFKTYGHETIIVTMRYEHEEDNLLNSIKSKLSGGINVYYTGRKAKIPFMKKLGIEPDIWIDDNPQWLFTDSK